MEILEKFLGMEPHNDLCNILIFHVCVVDNVIVLLCDWVVFLDYWNGKKWDVIIGYLGMVKLLSC